jgi:hypothetical protein
MGLSEREPFRSALFWDEPTFANGRNVANMIENKATYGGA